MTAELTDDDRTLLNEPHIGFVATVMADGSPQITPVWVDTDGEAILFNTAKGRVKTRNIERQPSVALLVIDEGDPYRWVAVRGEAEFVEGDADGHIDKLSKKYLDKDSYPFRRPDEQRVILRIKPHHGLEFGVE